MIPEHTIASRPAVGRRAAVVEAVSAAEVTALGWDALRGPDDFFLSPRWLRLLETSTDIRLRYLVSRRGDHSVAGLATALLDDSAPWLLGRPDTLLRRSQSQRMPGAAECLARFGDEPAPALLPSLVCGGRHLGRTRALHDPTVTGRDLAELVAHAERLAAGCGAVSVSFLYVDARDVTLRTVLAGRGYRAHVSGAYNWLPIPAGGLDGWLGSMSPHRRRRIRAERRRIAAGAVEVGIEPLTERLVPRLAVLETMLFAKYGMDTWRPAQSEAVLRRVLDIMGADAQVSLARAGDDVRGFALLLRDRGQWHAHRAGFDYPFLGTLPLYFEVIFYRPVAAAADEGIHTIHYGVGGEATKRSRGCRASTQYAYLLPLAGGAR